MSKKQLCLSLKPKVFLEPKTKRAPGMSPLALEDMVLSMTKNTTQIPLKKTELKLNKKVLKSDQKPEISLRTKKTPQITRKKSQENLQDANIDKPKKKLGRPRKIRTPEELEASKKEKKEKQNKPRCMARIASGEQCRRTQNFEGGVDLCTCHEKHCPHGRIDGPFEGKFLNLPKKRGPKFKNSKEYKIDELDSDLYIQTQLIKVDGNYYLSGPHGLLFTNDNHCEIVGRCVGDEIHWYV